MNVLGFVGSGNIATAMVTGLCRSDKPPEKIVVSDKDNRKAQALAARFPQVTALKENQDVADAGDCIFVCVLPQIAPDVLKALRFRKDQIVVTVVAIRSLSEMTAYAPSLRPKRSFGPSRCPRWLSTSGRWYATPMCRLSADSSPNRDCRAGSVGERTHRFVRSDSPHRTLLSVTDNRLQLGGGGRRSSRHGSAICGFHVFGPNPAGNGRWKNRPWRAGGRSGRQPAESTNRH